MADRSFSKVHDEIMRLEQSLWHRELTKPQVQALMAQLLEEAGELAGAFRSHLGRQYAPEKTSNRDHVLEEIGDSMGILLVCAHIMGATPLEVLSMLMNKLQRIERKKNDLNVQNNSTEPIS